MLVFSLLAAGGIGLLLKFPTGNVLADFGLPTLAATFIAASLGLLKSLRAPVVPVLGMKVIHLGVILALIGVFVSSSSQQEIILDLSNSKPGTTRQGLSVSLLENNTSISQHWVFSRELGVEAPEYSEADVKLQVTYLERSYTEVASWQGSTSTLVS